MNALKEAVAFAQAAECHWPKSMFMPDGQFVMTCDSGEKAPDDEVLGPITPRGGASGLVYRSGKLIAEWGDTDRADMTFSVAKSYLALLAGLALGDGLIESLDDKVAGYVLDDGFASEQNKDITWRHLLTQTSEWQRRVAFLLPGVPLTFKAQKPKDYSERPQTLGQRLKRRRRMCCLIQREAAEEVGVCKATYANWENDKAKPVTAKFKALVTFLGYDPTA